MKRQFFQKLLQPLFVTRRDLLITFVGILIWLGGIYGRNFWLRPSCASPSHTCTPSDVLEIDRLSLGMENPDADGYSFLTQNLSGAVGLLVPLTWDLSLATLGKITPTAALTLAGTDLLLILQTAAFNGVFTEISHLVGQRPRPFVYSNPHIRGTDPAHYTSFYSGHTSFAAAMNTTVFLILLARSAPFILLVISVLSSELLVFLTGYFRILAGRHFLTDVLFGAIAGCLIAYWVIDKHRKASPTQSKHNRYLKL